MNKSVLQVLDELYLDQNCIEACWNTKDLRYLFYLERSPGFVGDHIDFAASNVSVDDIVLLQVKEGRGQRRSGLDQIHSLDGLPLFAQVPARKDHNNISGTVLPQVYSI